MGKKTAYIELNTTNQIHFLHKNMFQKHFSYFGITFFPCVTVTSLSKILDLNFDYFVLDFGVINTHTATCLLSCDQRFIVCSLVKWKMQKTEEKLKELIQHKNFQKVHMTILHNLSTEKSCFFNFSNQSFRVVSFPFIPNPFHLKPNTFHVFHQILERN